MVLETKIVEGKKRQRSTSENILEDKYITEYKIEKIEEPETTEIIYDEKQSSPLPCDNFESKEETSNNYVDMMVNYTKNLKDREHQKQLEILEVELKIQKEKLKSAILEREILEIRKAKMDKQ